MVDESVIGSSSSDNEISPQAIQNPVDETKTDELRKKLDQYERLFRVDENALRQPTTTRRELWSYYLYYNASASSQLSEHFILTKTG